MNKQETKAKPLDRLNFAKMMAQQEKQINETPHIKNLLKPTTDHNFEKVDNSNILLKKLEEIEKQIHASRVSKIENALIESNKKSYEIKNTKPIYALAISMILVSAAILYPKTNPVVKTKVVVTEKVQENQFVITSFINLRKKPSGSSEKLSVLSPNYIVTLLERKNQWTKISFENHLTSKKVIGWIYGNKIKKI